MGHALTPESGETDGDPPAGVGAPAERGAPSVGARVRVDGKFFRAGGAKWYAKGFTYGPFAPGPDGEHLPDRDRVRSDLAKVAGLGGNSIRVYYPPPAWLLDDALESGLRVLIDVPWEKHRCFFEDWDAIEAARRRVRATARAVGAHPAVLAISVANEFPADIVRFYGARRVERFVEELFGIVREESDGCLVTFVNYPTTEFLDPKGCDFHCFNVYLHDLESLGEYLDRLQHLAGNAPLVLGEYGVDSIRHGEEVQAGLLARHVDAVFRRGLAGTYVFSFTDDWYRGGAQIEDWAFGVTRRDRSEKTAASWLKEAWSDTPRRPRGDLPRVSVVVCAYNAAATLRECLESLTRLDYPDYEVILVDDGSEDETLRIAEDFPDIIYARERNRGLSAARNAGAATAVGEIVAYTDADCVADEHWLTYLVQGMRDQRVEAIGGPNIVPTTDGWVAKCVAASPGNPSHVMLDDRHAEHVPGCNMAFRRETLLGLRGFDPQFRQAADDVDICWRLLDANLPIGYAPAAMVWHHRRPTVSAYLKQQRGYGRSEAMLHFKHPQRFKAFGSPDWAGIIYGDGALGLPLLPDTVYHGRFGLAPFQSIYRHNHYGAWAYLVSLEWHLVAAFILLMATLYPPLALLSGGMWSATVASVARSAWKAPLARNAPWWCRPLIALLYLLQPIVRGWSRLTHLLRYKRLPAPDRRQKRLARQAGLARRRPPVKRVSFSERDLYWHSDRGLGRSELLQALLGEADETGWWGDFHNAWSSWDLKLGGDLWHDLTIRTATEDLGSSRRFTRARCAVRTTVFTRVVLAATLVWSAAALLSGRSWAVYVGLAGVLLTTLAILRSRSRCFRAVTDLAARAGRAAGLQATGPSGDPIPADERTERPPPAPMLETDPQRA